MVKTFQGAVEAWDINSCRKSLNNKILKQQHYSLNPFLPYHHRLSYSSPNLTLSVPFRDQTRDRCMHAQNRASSCSLLRQRSDRNKKSNPIVNTQFRIRPLNCQFKLMPIFSITNRVN
jgi:hypothetical protein